MIEISGDDARQAADMVAAVDDQHLAPFMSAIMTAIEQAMVGECATCSCDVCVTVRGTLAGVTAYLGQQP